MGCYPQFIEQLQWFGLERSSYSVPLVGMQVIAPGADLLKEDDWSNVGTSATSWETLHAMLKERYTDAGGAFEVGRNVRSMKQQADGSLEVGIEGPSGESLNVSADRLVGADGASSTVRRLCESSQTKRTYAGYVAWRGRVPEQIVSQTTFDVLNQKVSAFPGRSGRSGLCYTIPGDKDKDGLMEGKRLLNWLDYTPYTSTELGHVMTDKNGTRHAFTVPPGQVDAEAWRSYKEGALPDLPAVFQELIQKTDTPLIQAITDTLSDKASFLDGKVLLVGEAIGTPRPHAVSGVTQGALAARKLYDLFSGECSTVEWETAVLETVKENCEAGIQMAQSLGLGRASADEDVDLEDYLSWVYGHQKVQIAS